MFDGTTTSGGDWWVVIILFALIFGWGGNGFGANSGANDNYVLTSDFSQLSQQISNATSMTERKLDGVTNGICSLGYDQLAQMNGINTNIAQNGYDTRLAITTLGSQVASGVTDIASQMQSGFCQTNFNNQSNTRDIVDSQTAGTQAILTKLAQMEASAKDEKIAELQSINADLRLRASQEAQNTYLVNALRPSPVPAYSVANPYAYTSGCSGCGF